MTIEERVAAIERTLAHQEEMRKLREINESLAVSRLERMENEAVQAKKVLPRLQAAIKELEESAIVTAHQQTLQGQTIKDHHEWMANLTQAMAKLTQAQDRLSQAQDRLSQAQDRTDEHLNRIAEEHRERGRALDERIDKFVSAIREWIRRNGEKPEQ